MLQLLGRVGGVLRGLYLLGFAALWGFASFSANLWGADPVTVTGIGGLALLFGVGGFVILFKAMLVPKRSAESKWMGEETAPSADLGDQRSEIDADAAIERYMANRAEPAPALRPAAPARPSFGRKGVFE